MAYSLGIVLNKPIFRPEYFQCVGCKYLEFADNSTLDARNSVLGWDFYFPELGWDSYRGGKRRGPVEIQDTCGSVFGDSFAHADEVMDDEAWPFTLSELMKCKIENFGVGGYGLDQAYLKYQRYKPEGNLVILALNQEMVRRSFAASWRFYASYPKALPKPFFRLHNQSIEIVKAPTMLDSESIRTHHAYDRYAAPFVVNFPYSLALARVLYYRALKSAYELNRLEPYEIVWNYHESQALTSAILKIFYKNVSDDGKRLILLILPTPEQVALNRRPYDRYIANISAFLPNLCIVDPFPSLRAKYTDFGPIRAPKGHFNNAGNDAIAEAVFRSLFNKPTSIHGQRHSSHVTATERTPSSPIVIGGPGGEGMTTDCQVEETGKP